MIRRREVGLAAAAGHRQQRQQQNMTDCCERAASPYGFHVTDAPSEKASSSSKISKTLNSVRKARKCHSGHDFQ